MRPDWLSRRDLLIRIRTPWGDLSDTTRHHNVNYLMQGVTTVFTGNDGGGPFEIAEWLALWEKQGIGTNAGLQVGRVAVRRQVMGMRDGAPTPEELSI